jgi:hypothetical protein
MCLKGQYNENQHGAKVVSIDSLWLAIVPMDIFYKFKGPSLFKKHKRVFSVKRHFVIEWSVNVESAVNLCGSGAVLQYIFEDRLRLDCKVANNVPFAINFFRIGRVTFFVSSAEKRVWKQIANDNISIAQIIGPKLRLAFRNTYRKRNPAWPTQVNYLAVMAHKAAHYSGDVAATNTKILFSPFLHSVPVSVHRVNTGFSSILSA